MLPLLTQDNRGGKNLNTRKERMDEIFKHLNRFKRNRVLYRTRPERDLYELRMFQNIDQLELSLRALQKDFRVNGDSGYTGENDHPKDYNEPDEPQEGYLQTFVSSEDK